MEQIICELFSDIEKMQVQFNILNFRLQELKALYIRKYTIVITFAKNRCRKLLKNLIEYEIYCFIFKNSRDSYLLSPVILG